MKKLLLLTIASTFSAGVWADCSTAKTSFESQSSFCFKVSQIHKIGLIQFSIADNTFLFIISFVSPNICLLSECQIITYLHHNSFNISGLTSQV